MLNTISGALLIGLIIGIVVGGVAPRRKIGCVALLAVPVAMFGYVAWWQGQHPENLTSTSGLDYIFGALWPSIGALAGFYAAQGLRDYLKGRSK